MIKSRAMRYKEADTKTEYGGNSKYGEMLMRLGSKHMEIDCIGTGCYRCKASKKAYHVCPGCGKEVGTAIWTVCQCGTWLCQCGNNGRGHVVSEYIIPSEAAKEILTKEDTV